MDLQDFIEFLSTYEGQESDEARDRYRTLISSVNADFDIVDLVDHHDAEPVKRNIATALYIAECIGYRYQAFAREPIEEGAIFIDSLPGYQYGMQHGGPVGRRYDWIDREDDSVRDFLLAKYPPLENAIRNYAGF